VIDGMKIILIGSLLVMLGACATQEQTAVAQQKDAPVPLAPLDVIDGQYWVDLPGQDGLTFYGQQLSSEVSSNGAGVMYPGGDMASFLVSIALHAAIQTSVTEAKEQTQRDAANLILEPYRELINQTSLADLMLSSEETVDTDNGQAYTVGLASQPLAADGWHTVVDPVFIMSRSSDSITIKSKVSILDGRIELTEEDLESDFSQTIFFQSLPIYESEKWLRDDGEYFRMVTSDLLRSSVDLAIQHFAGLSPPQASISSTIRYLNNGEKKVERGYLIGQTCTHIIFESLRGDIKSVPRLDWAGNHGCAAVLESS